MTDKEYQDKKRECWEEFKRTNLDGEVRWQPVDRYDVFCAAFDRAYALGKQEKDAEDDKTLKVNRQLFCRLCADADDYINEHLEEEDSDYTYYQGRSDALHELYRGECKAATTVIQGWVAIDEADNECYLHTNKPTHEVRPIADAGDYESHWGSERLTYLQTYLLDADLFPDMDSDSEPQECEIIIKRKKK